MQEKIQKISPIKQRILQFVDTLGVSKRDFYARTGISRGTLESATGITEDTITKVFAAYPNLSPSWVITGVGEKEVCVKNNNKNANLNANLNANPSPHNNINIDQALSKVDHVDIKFPDLLDNEEPTSVPFYDLPVSAGSLGVLDFASSEIPAPKGYVQLSVFRGCEYVFPIIGISMEPIIYSGDWIGIKHIDNLSRSWDFVQTGVIYLIVTNEDRMIKFIEQASDNEDYIICSSPNYKSFKVFKGDIINIYRVKAFARGL